MNLEEQAALFTESVDKSGINIVTCGQCGLVVFHYVGISELQCPHCGYESEVCDFPDFYTYNPYLLKDGV